MTKLLNELQMEELLLDYKNKELTVKQISIKFNTNIRQVYKFVANSGIKTGFRKGYGKRKYLYNERIFKTIDAPEKAYWIGFLMADGWINKTRLGLSLKDGEMIYKFRHFLGNEDIPIKVAKNCAGIYNQKLITLNSRLMINDLSIYGLIQNKTFITQIKNIPERYLSHFIRGYFDGDGCLYSSKDLRHNKLEICSSSIKILYQIQEILKKNNVLKKENYVTHRNDYKCSSLIVSNMKELILFCEFIYKDSAIRLERKYNKYLIIKSKPQFKKRKNAGSIYFGVSVKSDARMMTDRTKKKYVAFISINKETKWIGSFYTEKEAAIAYNIRATELGFPDFKLNKI